MKKLIEFLAASCLFFILWFCGIEMCFYAHKLFTLPIKSVDAVVIMTGVGSGGAIAIFLFYYFEAK